MPGRFKRAVATQLQRLQPSEAREVQRAEPCLRPGLQYVAQVEAVQLS